jgi:hypothetical protein
MASDVKLSANLVSFLSLWSAKADGTGRYTGIIGRFKKCRFDYDVAKAPYPNFDR